MRQAVLRPQQLERMQQTADSALPDQITIFRLQRTYDGGGGWKEVWTEHSTLPALVGLPLGGETDERSVSDVRLADEDLQTAWIPAEADVRKTDQVEWEGRRFEVYAVLQRGNWEIRRRIRIKEL
jgi:hypothetical protein